MSNRDFDRVVIRALERPEANDIVLETSQAQQTLRDVLLQLFAHRFSSDTPASFPSAGVIGNGLRVRPVSPLVPGSVVISPGMGFQVDPANTPVNIGGVVGLNDISIYKPLELSADQVVPIPALPGAGLERWDLIEVKYRQDLVDPETRDIFDVATQRFLPGIITKTLTADLLATLGPAVISPAPSTTPIGYKIGPSQAVSNPFNGALVTPGYMALAWVYLTNGTTTIDSDAIIDARSVLAPYGLTPISAVASIASGAGTGPTDVSLQLPPGIIGTFVTNVLGMPARAISLIIFTGSQSGTGTINPELLANLSVTPKGSAGTDTVFTVVKHAWNFGITDAAMQARVAGARANPPLKVALNQPFIELIMVPVQQAAGATGQTFADLDPQPIHVSGFVRINT